MDFKLHLGPSAFAAARFPFVLNGRGAEKNSCPVPAADRIIIADVKQIKGPRSISKPLSNTIITVKANGLFETTLPLRQNDVFLLSLLPKKQRRLSYK